MRLELLLLGLFCIAAAGCNADPRCRRETALLRAEIIDLEDQYYALKSRHEAAESELSTFRKGSGVTYGTDVFYEDDVFYDNGGSPTIYSEIQPGEYAPQEYIDPGFELNGPAGIQTFEGDPSGLETVYPAGENPPANTPSASSNRARSRSGDRFGNSNNDAVLLNGPTISRVSSAQGQVTEIVIHRASTRTGRRRPTRRRRPAAVDPAQKFPRGGRASVGGTDRQPDRSQSNR